MKERIIELLQTPKHQLLTLDEIYKYLSVATEEEKDLVANALESLENDFIITHNSSLQFALLPYFNLYKGIINIKESGIGYLDMEFGSIKIEEKSLNSAMNSDEVIVNVVNKKSPLKGIVTRIIKRSITSLVGVVIKVKKKYYVKSLTNKILVFGIIEKPSDNLLNKIVKADISKYYAYNSVKVSNLTLIGDENEVGMDIKTQVIASGVNYEFTPSQIEEAKNLNKPVIKEMFKNRVDLTNELIFTIDGDDAKDFDDAVGLTITKEGYYNLKVCIADVSEYVKENSCLDMEALTRGTSIYLPDRVIPMLPLELSNGICSLNEGVNRLVMVCDIILDQNAKVIETKIYEGIIKSSHRLTYGLVNKIIEEDDQETILKYKDTVDTLVSMNNLAEALYKKRLKRGAFEFETSEVKVNLDEFGKPISLEFRTRRSAEKLIEEFMLLANEQVATTMDYLDVPFIYRVHDEPDSDRLNTFFTRIKALNREFSYKNKQSLPHALQAFLQSEEESLKDKTLKVVLSMTLLRSMQKAKYLEENIGHYGLQSKCYTHFTSPIRRYPDLLVHRLIKTFLLNEPQVSGDSYTYYEEKVRKAALISSNTEKVAERLERDTLDMKKCEYMEQFIGKTFIGIVSSIVNWGLYVTLDNTVEGLVRFENLPYDFYEVDEKKGIIYGNKKDNKFSLGDLVKVKLMDINVQKHQINFKLLGKVTNETDSRKNHLSK